MENRLEHYKREKKLAFNTIILFLGQFFPQISALITLPIYTGFLSQAEYGRYDLINVVVYILNVVAIIQIHQALFRFLIDVRGSIDEKKYITSALIFEMVPSVVFSVIFGLINRSVPISTRFLLGAYLFLNIQFGVAGQIARGLGKNSIYAFGAIIHSFSNLFLVVVLVAQVKLGFNGLFISLDSSLLMGIIIQIILCKQWEKIDIWKFDRNALKEMLNYSWPMVPNTLSIWIVNTCDKFMIRAFLGLEFNGVFAAAQKIPNLFTMAYSTFNQAWQESASVAANDDDYDKYYNNIFKALFDFLIGFLLILIASSPLLFKILIRGDYDLAYKQMPFLYIGVFLSCISSFFGSIYVAKKATRAVGISSGIGAVINVIVNWFLIGWVGIYAASISTIISYLILVVYRVQDVEKKHYAHICYNKLHIIKCITLVLLCSTLCYIDNKVFNCINFLIGLVVFFSLNNKYLKAIYQLAIRKVKRK